MGLFHIKFQHIWSLRPMSTYTILYVVQVRVYFLRQNMTMGEYVNYSVNIVKHLEAIKQMIAHFHRKVIPGIPPPGANRH